LRGLLDGSCCSIVRWWNAAHDKQGQYTTVKTIKSSQAVYLTMTMIIFAQRSLHKGKMLEQHQENQVLAVTTTLHKSVPVVLVIVAIWLEEICQQPLFRRRAQYSIKFLLYGFTVSNYCALVSAKYSLVLFSGHSRIMRTSDIFSAIDWRVRTHPDHHTIYEVATLLPRCCGRYGYIIAT